MCGSHPHFPSTFRGCGEALSGEDQEPQRHRMTNCPKFEPFVTPYGRSSNGWLIALFIDWFCSADVCSIMLRHLASVYDGYHSEEIGASAIGSRVGSDLSMSLSPGIAKRLPDPTVALALASDNLLGRSSTQALGKVFIQCF